MKLTVARFEELASKPESWNDWIDGELSKINDDVKFLHLQLSHEDIPKHLRLDNLNLSRVSLHFNFCRFDGHHEIFHGVNQIAGVVFHECKNFPMIQLVDCEIGVFEIHNRQQEIHTLGFFRCTFTERVKIVGNGLAWGFNMRDCSLNYSDTRAEFEIINHNFKGCFTIDDCSILAKFRIHRCVFQDEFHVTGTKLGFRIIPPEFTQCTFSSLTNFADTIFCRAPRFDGSELYQQTIFPDLKGFSIFDVTAKSPLSIDIASIQLLKAKSSELLNRRQQAMFFTLEQKLLAKSGSLKRAEKVIAWCYRECSEYGTDMAKPLILLLLFSVTFMCLFVLMGAKLNDSLTVIESSLILTIQDTLLPLKALPTIAETTASTFMYIASVVQSLVSLVLIALFALTVRWSFKRD